MQCTCVHADMFSYVHTDRVSMETQAVSCAELWRGGMECALAKPHTGGSESEASAQSSGGLIVFVHVR